MYKSIEIRVIDEALYIIENKATVRQTAKEFKIGKQSSNLQEERNHQSLEEYAKACKI